VSTVVIVDDEPPARRKLARLLQPHTGFRIVGEAGAGEAAVAVIDEQRPDLLFLDVQLPDVTGFEVLNRLAEGVRPLTIFVTAYHHYAVEAFQVRALDYLLKPVSQSRFDEALGRAREQLEAPANYLKRVLVREERISYFVETGEILWLESARNYVVLHTDGRAHVVRATLEGLLERLDPGRFVRISRSAVVNLDKVKALTGDAAVLVNGERVKASARHVSGLKSAHWV